jgi:hypothetical protein
VTGSRLSPRAVLNGLNGLAQTADDAAQGGNTPGNGLRRKQVIASFVPATAFTGFAPGNFQVLWQLFAEATAKTLLHVRANGIQASDLLFDQFTSAIILDQNFRIFPKILKKLAGKPINTE